MKKDDQDDLKYFLKAMQGVRPLIQDKVVFKKDIKLNLKKTMAMTSKNLSTNLQDITAKNIRSEEKLFFTRPGGLQHNLLQKLRQGKIKITRILDLHGMAVDEARQAVDHFIKQSITQYHRYILIIHGKGKSSQDTPTLKNHVNHWLMQIPAVLAFCSAIPKDGGTGAVYVVLKNTNK